jgi:hypothetical protein
MPASPVVIPVQLLSNPDGTLRTTNPFGDYAPSPSVLSIDLAAFALAIGSFQNLQTGGSISFNLRGAWLTGTESATCTFGVRTITGDDVATHNWVISGALLNQSLVSGSIGNGTLEIYAIAAGGQQLSFGQKVWSIVAPPGGSDTLAPSVPINITAIADPAANNSILVGCDACTDIAQSATLAGGVDHYTAFLNGVAAGSPVPAQPSTLGPGTLINLGNITSPATPTVVQSGKQFTLTAAGTGIHNTATEQCLLYGWQLSGARKMTLKVNSYTSANADSTAGFCLHNTGAQGGIFVAGYLNPSGGAKGLQWKTRTQAGGLGTNKATLPTDSTGAAIVGPVYLTVERLADLSTVIVSYSLDGQNPIQVAIFNIPMQQIIYWTLLLASQTAGTTCSVVIEEVSITAAPRLSFTVPATSTKTVTVKAVDLAGNTSAASAGVVATPTTPTTFGGVKFRGGHFSWYGSQSWNPGSPTNQALIFADLDRMAGSTDWSGVKIAPFWGFLEGSTQGDFTAGRALLQAYLDKCNQITPKKNLIFQLTDRTFGTSTGSVPSGKYPAYLVSAGLVEAPASGVNTAVSSAVAWWKPAAADALISMWEDYGAHFDTDPRIEMIAPMEETALSSAGYSWNEAAALAQFKRIMSACSAAWPHTLVRFLTNYGLSNDNMVALFDYAKQFSNVCFGGPDPEIPSGTAGSPNTTFPLVYPPGNYPTLFRTVTANAEFRGLRRTSSGTWGSAPNGTDYRNQLIWVAENQTLGLDNTKYTNNSPTDLANYQHSIMNASYQIWVATGILSSTKTAINNYVASIAGGNLNTIPPPNVVGWNTTP